MRAEKVTHCRGQGTRVVHDVAALQKVCAAELLTSEFGGHGDDLHPGGQCPFDPRGGVLDRQGLIRPHTQLASR
jgi:hypothetical protein